MEALPALAASASLAAPWPQRATPPACLELPRARPAPEYLVRPQRLTATPWACLELTRARPASACLAPTRLPALVARACLAAPASSGLGVSRHRSPAASASRESRVWQPAALESSAKPPARQEL